MKPFPPANELVLRYFRWAAHIARSLAFAYRAEHLAEDLVSRAVEALVEASRSYDLERGVRFDFYARKRVAGEVIELILAEQRQHRMLRCLAHAASRRTPFGEPTRPSRALEELDAIAEDFLDELELAARASDAAEDRVLLNEIGLRLDTDDRSLVQAHCVQGLSWLDIERTLGVPERTARARLGKLRVRLREHAS
jgi:RNA polymerase sigma factor (sigma-70 family)